MIHLLGQSCDSLAEAHEKGLLQRDIKPGVQICSISGGTDIVSCFVGGDPTRAVYAGEIQGPGFGSRCDRPGQKLINNQGRAMPKPSTMKISSAVAFDWLNA